MSSVACATGYRARWLKEREGLVFVQEGPSTVATPHHS